MKPPLGDSGCDMLGWKWSETRHFSVRSTYAMGAEQTMASADSIWSCISKFKGFPKIKTFLWLLAKGRLMKNLERVRRHIVVDNQCGVCAAHPKSLDHLFRWCPAAISVWSALVKPSKFAEFLNMERMDWLQVNLMRHSYFASDPEHWNFLFSVVLWRLWLIVISVFLIRITRKGDR
ncbi:hypothetical protein V6N11_059146 [Hibiscus sabdariffa]|uniref:Reverse transcriptase zinc-binding domain-containing protein n=1 Tax=Hibiscus sabdariffa TaxID=183260 RepID=A0ABR2U713_9ROSI